MSDTKKIADLALTDDTNTVKLIDFARGENSSSQLCQMPDNFSEVGRETCLNDNTDCFSSRCFLCFIFISTFFFFKFKLSGIK